MESIFSNIIGGGGKRKIQEQSVDVFYFIFSFSIESLRGALLKDSERKFSHRFLTKISFAILEERVLDEKKEGINGR